MNIPELYYYNHNSWEKLPEWGGFFLKVGAFIANYNELNKRLVVGIALPTKAFAATLLAMGIVSTKSNHQNNGDVENHFNYLKSLPIDTPLYYMDGKRKKVGYFKKVTHSILDGREQIVIYVPEKRLEKQMSAEQVFNEVSVVTNKDLNVSKRQKGSTIIASEGFLKNLLKNANIYEFALHTTLECEIIGQVNCLRQEIVETPFAVNVPDEGFKEGLLKDILRVRKFLSEGDGYRVDIFSANKKPPRKKHEIPPVAIFDGAHGFINWRDRWRGSHWIVILDRTEMEYENAARLINDNETQRQTNRLSFPFSPPPRIELSIYEEVKR